MEYTTSILVPSKWNMLQTKAGCACSFRVHVELITKSKPIEGKANTSQRIVGPEYLDLQRSK